MENEIKQAWKQGYVRALTHYTELDAILWKLAEEAWQEIQNEAKPNSGTSTRRA